MNNFNELEKQIQVLNRELGNLKLKKRIRMLLKIVGIGFLIYKNVYQEISEKEEQKKALIIRLDSTIQDHLHYFEYERDKISSSQQFLTNTEKEKWFEKTNVLIIELDDRFRKGCNETFYKAI